MTTPCLEIVQIACQKQQRQLFHSLNVTLLAGDLLLIQGDNGSGKSSFLRLLAGLATPSEGVVRWQQQSILDNRDDYQAAMHYVGHTNGIKLGLTVMENLQLAGHLASAKPAVGLASLLADLQLHRHPQAMAATLSAGQKRRLGLAKLFLYPKRVWILDEPLTALDAHTQTYFQEKLSLHLQQGGIAMISSHHPIACDATNIHVLSLSS